MRKDLHPGPSAWPASGGEMGVWLRAFDWEKTPLGPISSWPQSLKTTVDLMMASQLAMYMMWGPERIQIYNEAQRAFMGTKHPLAFGRPARESWGEVWEVGEPTHQRVFAGETVTLVDQPWTLLRNAAPEETFFTSYFTPVRDEMGAVVAALVTAFETTQAVKEKAERDRAERGLRESEARLAQELEGARQLQQVSLELLSNRPELLYEQILDAAMVVMRSQAASMQILEPDTEILKLLAWRGFHPDAAAFWDRVDCNSASACGEALKTGQRTFVSDSETCAFMAGTEDLEAYRLSNLRAVQSTPLRSRNGRVLGMVSTHWREPHEPSKDDFSRFDVLAREAADLLERAQTEAALRGSEARLREVLEGIGEAFYALDQDQRFLYASRKALETWGKMRGDLTGRPFLEAFPHALGTQGYEAHQRALETGEAQHLELVSPLLRRWFEVDIYPSSAGVSVAFRDVEQRKQAEAALLASEARLKAAVELVGLSLYSGDPRTGTLEWDPRLKAMWGLPADAPVDVPMAMAAIHPDDQARVVAAWEASLEPAGGGVFGAEYRVLGIQDGVERWVSTHAQNFFEQQQPVRFIGAIREITAEKRAEARLRESETRLQAAVDLVRLGRFAWNPQTNELRWDDTLRAMWGLAAGAPVDYEVWRAGVHPDDLARVEAAVERCADPRGDGVYDIEYRVIGKADNVERWIAVRGRTNFENDAPVSSFGVALDVTDRKRIETTLERRVEDRTRELEEANRQLRSQIEKRESAEAEVQQLLRLEAIGQITSGVAHDFNNLLSVVLTNTRLLSRTVQRPDDQEGIELIGNAAERGAKLIAQLLAFSRQQQLEPLAVDLNSTLVGMSNLLRVTLGGTLQLKTTFAPDLWPALVDPNQIELIVLNLAINARDAMQPGGTLTLETFNTVIESASLRPEEPSPGDYVALAVKDTGTGIPDEVLLHVFEPFFTTKEPGKGSGLGLAQVFGFAKQSGGGVRIETGAGQGTAVTIFLPRAAVDVSDDYADVVDASNRPQTSKRLRVLVVDDDKPVLRSTVRTLDVLGYAAVSAESGSEALQLLASNQEIDLVLADFAMPEMSGGEVAKAIRAMRPTLPVVLMTGYRNLDVLEEFNDLGIILKPFAEDDLVNALVAALR